MNVELLPTLAGVGVGALAVKAWDAWPGRVYFNTIQSGSSPLAVFEHYHVGLAFTLAEWLVPLHGAGMGFGAALIADEFTHVNPFGIGKPTQAASLALGLGLVAAIVVAATR